MGRRGAAVAVTIISLAVAGCVATTPFYTSEKLERGGAPPRVVLMPPDVQLSELTAGGLLEPKAEWTAKAEKHITAAIRELMQEREARLVVYDPASGGSDKDARTQLIKLHGAVGMSILVHKYLSPQQLPTKEGKFDWSLGPQARLLGDEYDADYALFIFIRDSYTSGGRAFAIFAAALFGVAPMMSTSRRSAMCGTSSSTSMMALGGFKIRFRDHEGNRSKTARAARI